MVSFRICVAIFLGSSVLVPCVFAACPFATRAPAADSDLQRAARSTPTGVYTASGAKSIRASLNEHLKSGSIAYQQSAPCEEFSLEQLADLQHTLLCSTDQTLVTLSGGTREQGNRRAPKHLTAEALKAHHAAEAQDIAVDPTGLVAEAVRDGRCHQVAMSWVHHISAETRASLNQTMPLLPQKGLEEHTAALNDASAVPAEVKSAVLSNLTGAVTCQVGHEAQMEPRGKWEGFPHWPYEVEYTASGYGPYPFWTGGPSASPKFSGPGVAIHTRWSAVQNAERLDHASCSLSNLGGKDGPCTHLFLNGSWAFLYAQDESFCCMSSAPARYTPCHLTRPQRNFMDVFNYDGVLNNYTSEDGLYSGKAKKYSMHLTNPSNFWFWYVTDMDDKPLEQGEGPCDMYDQWGTRTWGCQGPPHMLFHQYHRDSFKSTTIDPSVFERPEVCKRTPYTYCMVQPTNFCGDSNSQDLKVEPMP